MDPNEIKTVLTSLGAKPNKKLGQHFLIDQAALDAVVEAADIHPEDVVLEVGPGLGVLTERLVQAGADVHAIEQDRFFIPYLEKKFSGHALRVMHGDAATILWEEFVPETSWKLVSNLPYSITSLAIRKALWTPHPATRVSVLVQREVAERAIAKDGKTSLLSLMVLLASSSARITRRVPAGAFFPPPKVESAVLEISSISIAEREARWGIDPEKIMALAKLGFAHARKQLASNLAAAMGREKSHIESALERLELNPKIRAEDLSVDQWAALTKALS